MSNPPGKASNPSGARWSIIPRRIPDPTNTFFTLRSTVSKSRLFLFWLFSLLKIVPGTSRQFRLGRGKINSIRWPNGKFRTITFRVYRYNWRNKILIPITSVFLNFSSLIITFRIFLFLQESLKLRNCSKIPQLRQTTSPLHVESRLEKSPKETERWMASFPKNGERFIDSWPLQDARTVPVTNSEPTSSQESCTCAGGSLKRL